MGTQDIIFMILLVGYSMIRKCGWTGAGNKIHESRYNREIKYHACIFALLANHPSRVIDAREYDFYFTAVRDKFK